MLVPHQAGALAASAMSVAWSKSMPSRSATVWIRKPRRCVGDRHGATRSLQVGARHEARTDGQSIDTLPVSSTVSRTSVIPLNPFARHPPLLPLPMMLTRL